MNNSPAFLIGNVTADPELTFTSSGQARLAFSIAVNHVWYNDANEKQEKASFFNIVAWRYTAENAAKTLSKGVGCICVGRLEQRSYDDKDGNKRSAFELVADDIAINTRSIEAVTRRAPRAEGESSQPARQGASASSSARRARPGAAPAMASAGVEDEPF